MCLYIFTKINIEVKVFSKQSTLKGTDYSNYSQTVQSSFFSVSE